MATIATDVQWGSSPKIYFDFSYEKKRDGSTQYYNISVSCDAISGDSYFGFPIFVQIYLDGTSKMVQTLKNIEPWRWDSALTFNTGWLAVSNKTSGTTALNIRIFSGSGSTRDTTYSYSLDIDPAASTIKCTTAHIGSNPTITIASGSSNFTHTVQYRPPKYKAGDPYVPIVEKTSATTITSWTIPEGFYEDIPNDTNATIWLSCTTYSGKTELGTKYCMFVATADETKCKPTVSGSVKDTNEKTLAVTGSKDILVRYCSTALCEISVTLNKKAGSVLTKTINNTAVTGNSLVIPNVEVGTFDFYAKDSRQYHNSDKEVLSLVPYIKLTANVTAWREDPTSGKARLKVDGNYFNGSFGAKSNTITVQYRVEGGEWYTAPTPTVNGNNYSVTVALTGLDYTKAFNYEVAVFDELSTVTKTTTIQKGIPVFDWGEEDFNFNVPVRMGGTVMVDFVVDQGVYSGWTYRKWNSGIAECWLDYAYKPIAIGNAGVSVYYPFSFIANPIVTATLGVNGTLADDVIVCDASGNRNNSLSQCELYLRNITTVNYNIQMLIHVVGKWK